MTYKLVVWFADEEYEAEVEQNVNELWEHAEIGHSELFEMVGVPYDPFDKWTIEELVDMTEWSCSEITE